MDVTIREQDGRRAIAVEVLSPPGDHRARALARRIARMKERYRNYLYLEVMPQGEQERPPPQRASGLHPHARRRRDADLQLLGQALGQRGD